jgi:hypothetical protein
VDVELARQQWDEGRRRIESERSADGEAYERLNAQVTLLIDELRKRIGQTFTLAELAAAYDRADDWARDVLFDAVEEGGGPPPDTATVTDAAFQAYAHRASDYSP